MSPESSRGPHWGKSSEHLALAVKCALYMFTVAHELCFGPITTTRPSIAALLPYKSSML
jgi:hypothetical protein